MSAHDALTHLPGYRIIRPLGRGGMASVYLAIQESVEREVALKIMAPQLSADPTFGERFLREARIAAKLHHRHVVSIFDVSVYEGVHYCAMEYLPGGPVMVRNGPPLALAPAVRCVREIAGALHYAQQKGFIHRDVKPDNILLREDGTSVLSDFGIARAADSGTIMTKTGSVVGTPHYMSPEQLRGRAIDGRADLYSLGVVFFQLLTGKVPYEASDALAVGIMHMTAPLPQLPAEYRFLQGVLERMLAKEPQDRFQTGWEIDQALEQIEIDRQRLGGETTLPQSRMSSAALPRQQPIQSDRRSGFDPQGAVRTEPQFGRMEEMDEARLDVSRRRGQKSGSADPGSRWWLWLLLIGILAGAGYWQRGPLSTWVAAQLAPAKDSELALAAVALESGRWYSGQGDDALSLYIAALQLDQNSRAAAEGLNETLRRLLERERGASAPDREQLQAIAQRLTGVRGFESQREAFLALASSEPRPQPDPPPAPETTPTQVTAPIPDSTETAQAAAAREAAAAEARRQAEAAQRLQTLLGQAEDLGRRGRWIEPAGNSAADRYLAVLALDSNHTQARNGLNQATRNGLAQIEAALETPDLAAAQRLLTRLRTLAPRTSGLREVQQRLERAQVAARRPSPEQQALHDQLIREGETALSSDRLLEPPGDAAFDKFRGAMAIDRQSSAAQAGLDALALRLRQRIAESLANGRVTRAHGDLQGLQSVNARDPQLPALRSQVARGYAENGLQLLERNRIPEARADLERAEALEPGNETAARLRAALLGR